jgi:hypothetical protein
VAEVAQKQLATGSLLRAFKSCRKSYEFRYEIGLRPAEDSFALSYGRCFHECVDILETTDSVALAADHARASRWNDIHVPHTLAAQVRAYYEHWKNSPFIAETLLSEHAFNIDLINPDTNRPSQTFALAGKIDAIVRLPDGRMAIRETKTVSEDPGPNSKYWLRLLMDPQITLYYIAARQLGYEVETVIYDVIRKPSIAPAMATPLENRKYTTRASKRDGVDMPAGSLYAGQREHDETPQEWEERLFADMMERPEFYLNRRELPRIEQDVEAFRFETWDVVKDLRNAQLTNRFYRTVTRSCDNCPYFGICTGLTPYEPGTVPEGFTVVSDIHPELQPTKEVCSL